MSVALLSSPARLVSIPVHTFVPAEDDGLLEPRDRRVRHAPLPAHRHIGALNAPSITPERTAA